MLGTCGLLVSRPRDRIDLGHCSPDARLFDGFVAAAIPCRGFALLRFGEGAPTDKPESLQVGS
jgi:hypothetical protein